MCCFPRAFSLLPAVFFLAVVYRPCRAGFSNGNHFWIPVGDNFQKAYLDDSTSDPGKNSIKAVPAANVSTMVHSSENQNCTVKHKQPMGAPSAPRPMGQPGAPTWELSQGTASLWEETEAPLPLQKRRCNLNHPKQLSPFPERLEHTAGL